MKVEVSRFNGREPDQHRWNIETGPLNSTAVRVSWNPTRTLALQGSWGHFVGSRAARAGGQPEALVGECALRATRSRPDGSWRGLWHGAASRSAATPTMDTRRGIAQACGLDRVRARRDDPEPRALAMSRTAQPIASAKCRSARSATSRSPSISRSALGGLFAVNFVPDALAPLYGGHNPTGAMGFVRLKLELRGLKE